MGTGNVYIATLPRSGSTMLGMMLGAHSQICHVGESDYWSKIDVCNSRCCCGLVGCKTLVRISEIISSYPEEISSIETVCGAIDMMQEPAKIRHHLSYSAHMLSPENFRQAFTLCCSGLEKITNAAREVTEKKTIVENSKYLSIAEGLLNRATLWKIIVMTRDPRGVALSHREAGKRKNVPRPVESKIELFRSFAEQAARLIRNEADVLHVRYEDLCRDPCSTLRRICTFLDVQYELEMMQFKTRKGHFLMGNHMMYDQNEEVCEDLSWREQLSLEEKSMFASNNIIRSYEKIGYNLEPEQ